MSQLPSAPAPRVASGAVEAPRPHLAPSPPPSPPRRGWSAFTASFVYAWDGVVETAVHQRNMRVHVVAGLLVGVGGSAVALPLAAQLALVFCAFLVPAAEVANSALEALVDLVTRERHDRARAAKDAGAGAVLVLAACAVVVLAAVLREAWPRLAAAPAAALRQAAIGVPLAGVAALLLAPLHRARALDAALGLAGLALLLGLAAGTASALFAGLAALFFAVAFAAARRRRRGVGVIF